MGRVTLGALNAMNRDEFVDALSGIFERSSWIPADCAEARPFASVEALHRKLVEVVEAASTEARLRLLTSHPELAGKTARSNQLTAESTAEQAGLGLNRLATDEAAVFDSLNRLYRQRFGFPFIIAVRGQRDRTSILRALEIRTKNTEAEEIDTALKEVGKIAWFRLSDLVQA